MGEPFEGGHFSRSLFLLRFVARTPLKPGGVFGELAITPRLLTAPRTYFHDPSHVTEAINSHGLRHRDKASEQSIKQTKKIRTNLERC